MSDRKIYNLIKVTSTSTREFNQVWAKEALPVWTEHGVRHIGSWSYFIGGPNNETIRLMEFDNLRHFDEWDRFLHDSAAGKTLIKAVDPYIQKVENFLLRKYPF